MRKSKIESQLITSREPTFITPHTDLQLLCESARILGAHGDSVIYVHDVQQGKDLVKRKGWTQQFYRKASYNPFQGEGLHITFYKGDRWFFVRTSGATWKFDPNRGYHDAGGVASTNRAAWIPESNEGALVEKDPKSGKHFVYHPDYDRSRGGPLSYQWLGKDPITFRIAMNDEWYPDNVGGMDFTLGVEPED